MTDTTNIRSINATLVAFYGEKPEVLQSYLQNLLQIIRDSRLGKAFESYSIQQIHATLCGLECFEIEDRLYNVNLYNQRKRKRVQNTGKLSKLLAEFLPLQMRFGGYDPDDHHMMSQNQTLFRRGFAMNENTRKILVNAWPVSDDGKGLYSLDKLRNSILKHCNIAHKYSNDNDMFMVLGNLRSNDRSDYWPQNSLSKLSDEVRKYMQSNPLSFSLQLSDLSVVFYENSELMPSQTKSYPLINHLNELDGLISSHAPL